MLPLALRQQSNPELRRHLTADERLVGQELHGKCRGVHFIRQLPLAPYIVACYCHQARLIVAIDGRPHRQQQGYDHLRDAYLAGWGIRVLRVTNPALRNELPSVVHLSRTALRQAP